MKNLIVLFNIKKIIISSYCHKHKDSSLKKMHMSLKTSTRCWYILFLQIPLPIVTNCNEITYKAKFWQKKVIYQDFTLADTKSMHRKWCYVWMLMLLLIQADLVQSAANLLVSILSIFSQIK